MKRRFVIIVMSSIAVVSSGAMAESPAPYPTFTFKRVGVPAKGSTNRIKVQIDPSVQRPPPPGKAAQAADAEDSAETPEPSGFEWFWAGISPKLEDSGPGRLSAAVQYLKNNPDGKTVAAPRLQQMQDIAQKHGADILKATIGTKVSPALVLAIIAIESSGDKSAVSKAGATGLMQLMPDTATRFGVSDATVAKENIKGGVAYLDWLMNEFDRDPVLVLAGYNAGEGSVRKYEGVPPFAETRGYVPKVLAAWTVARGLCLTPPELISDGCVFAVRGLASNE